MIIDVETCNLALNHLGDGTLLTDVETQKSEQANACRTFFPTALMYVLRKFDWGCHRVYSQLALVEESPNAEWKYSYRYPSSCVMARKIVSGIRRALDEQKIPFTTGLDDVGKLIYTDMYQATLMYTKLNDEADTWELDFKLAVSFYLAYLIAPRLKSGQSEKLKARMMAEFDKAMAQAAANSANEEEAGPTMPSSLEASRI